MRLQAGTKVIVAGTGTLFAGELVERRGKRQSWLVQKLNGTFQYVPIHAVMFLWDRTTWGKLCILFFNQRKAKTEWDSILGRIKRI